MNMPPTDMPPTQPPEPNLYEAPRTTGRVGSTTPRGIAGIAAGFLVITGSVAAFVATCFVVETGLMRGNWGPDDETALKIATLVGLMVAVSVGLGLARVLRWHPQRH